MRGWIWCWQSLCPSPWRPDSGGGEHCFGKAGAIKIGGKTLPIKHIPGPEGVRGRNSDNTLIKEVLGWAPSTSLEEGLGYTHAWIKTQIAEFGGDASTLTTSKICTQQMAEGGCDMTHAQETQ